jgi:hypothetical protein
MTGQVGKCGTRLHNHDKRISAKRKRRRKSKKSPQRKAPPDQSPAERTLKAGGILGLGGCRSFNRLILVYLSAVPPQFKARKSPGPRQKADGVTMCVAVIVAVEFFDPRDLAVLAEKQASVKWHPSLSIT